MSQPQPDLLYQAGLTHGYLRLTLPAQMTDADVEHMEGIFLLVIRQHKRWLAKPSDTAPSKGGATT